MRFTKIFFPCIALASLSATATATASAASDDIHGVFTMSTGLNKLGNGRFDVLTNSDNNSQTHIQSFDLSYDPKASISAGIGVETGNYRLILEAYFDTSDVEINGQLQADAEREYRSAFYSNYLIHPVNEKFSSILGVGLGYGETKLINVNGESFTNGAILAKFSLGTEYEVLPQFGLFLRYDNFLELQAMDDEKETNGAIESRNLEHRMDSRLNLGFTYKY